MFEAILFHFYGIVILTFLMLGMTLNQEKTKSTKYFCRLCMAAVCFLGLSMAEELTEMFPGPVWISYVINYLCFAAVDGVIIGFIFYMSSLMDGEEDTMSPLLKAAVGSCLGRAALLLILTFTGKLFTIDEGRFVPGPLESLSYVVTAVIMVMVLAAVIANREKFTRRQFTVIVLYIAVPILPVVVETVTGLYALTGIALTLPILLIYVLLQAVTIEKGKMRESVLEEISNKDLLTGLNNRRAYYQRISSLGGEQNVGVVFCDINGLKYVNDHFGHAAGDEMIRRFAEILGSSFSKHSAFRISGDEFVVIWMDAVEGNFRRRVEQCYAKIAGADYIAALGCSFGRGCRFDRLVAEAEQRMYEDKRQHGSRREEAPSK